MNDSPTTPRKTLQDVFRELEQLFEPEETKTSVFGKRWEKNLLRAAVYSSLAGVLLLLLVPSLPPGPVGRYWPLSLRTTSLLLTAVGMVLVLVYMSYTFYGGFKTLRHTSKNLIYDLGKATVREYAVIQALSDPLFGGGVLSAAEERLRLRIENIQTRTNIFVGIFDKYGILAPLLAVVVANTEVVGRFFSFLGFDLAALGAGLLLTMYISYIAAQSVVGTLGKGLFVLRQAQKSFDPRGSD
jgi:hypothetical protein